MNQFSNWRYYYTFWRETVRCPVQKALMAMSGLVNLNAEYMHTFFKMLVTAIQWEENRDRWSWQFVGYMTHVQVTKNNFPVWKFGSLSEPRWAYYTNVDNYHSWENYPMKGWPTYTHSVHLSGSSFVRWCAFLGHYQWTVVLLIIFLVKIVLENSLENICSWSSISSFSYAILLFLYK